MISISCLEMISTRRATARVLAASANRMGVSGVSIGASFQRKAVPKPQSLGSVATLKAS